MGPVDGRWRWTRGLRRLRGTVAASFAEAYVDDLVGREREQARDFLSGAAVDEAAFRRAVAAFGYQAAVLLDEDGWPGGSRWWPSRCPTRPRTGGGCSPAPTSSPACGYRSAAEEGGRDRYVIA